MGKNKTEINREPEWNPEETIDLEKTGDVELTDIEREVCDETCEFFDNQKCTLPSERKCNIPELIEDEAPVAVTNPDPTMEQVEELLPELLEMSETQVRVYLTNEIDKFDVNFRRSGCTEYLGMTLVNLRILQQAE
jgi:hypothetical protein